MQVAHPLQSCAGLSTSAFACQSEMTMPVATSPRPKAASARRAAPAQKKAVQFAFTDAAQRKRWSNFPDGTVNRAGVRLGEINATQKWALWQLLAQVKPPRSKTQKLRERRTAGTRDDAHARSMPLLALGRRLLGAA